MDIHGGRNALFENSLTQVCGVLAAGFGFVALLGWVLALPLLSSFGPRLVPMAPSTALLFGLLGGAVFSCARFPHSRAVRVTGLAIGAFGVLVGLLLFSLSYQGIYADVERLGIAAAGSLDGVPIGHMSPLTALSVFLAGLSLLASLSAHAGRPGRARPARGLAHLIIAAHAIFALAYVIGPPLLYGGGFIPPALPTSLAFVALGIALAATARTQAGPPSNLVEAVTARASYTLLSIFIIMAVGIVTAGHLYYRNHERHHRTAVGRELTAIADLKAGEIVQWKRERLGDATLFYRNPSFSAVVKRLFDNPGDSATQKELRQWLYQVQTAYSYDRIRLQDATGIERMAVPDAGTPFAPTFSRRASEALRLGKVVFEGFHRSEVDGRVYLSMIVPVFDETNQRAIGVLAMRIDPEKYLYPLINRWPTPSETAETLIVRREGSDVLFLNQLRFRRDTALKLRSPLDRTDMPAVQAVLGREGIVQGRDYREVPVIASVRAVPDSPWFLVARMDLAEVTAPLREKLWEVILLVASLLLGAGTVVGLVWRNQRTRFYREHYEAAEALRRLNRVLAVLSGINQAIVRIRDPRVLFDTVCRTAVEKGNFSLAWIGLFDAASGEVKVVAQAGTAGDYLGKIHLSLKDEPLGYCPIDSVLRTGKRAVCDVIGVTEALPPCRKAALDLGFRSSAALPLTVFGRIRGTVNLYADTPDHFDEAELKLLDEMAADISFAMEFDETKAARARAEEMTRISHRLLEIVHNNTEMLPFLEAYVSEIKRFTGCEAVGIRILDEEGKIPYRAYEGFSPKFYELENPLSTVTDHCMCINVITGAADPILPFYSEGGSFFINATTCFLATVSEEEKGKTRNVCNLEGYESVALVPFRMENRILGLIHVADHRENMVPLRTVKLLEMAALQMGTSLQRVRAEETVRESERRYRSLFENMLEGFAYCRMIYDNGAPRDFLYLDVNNAFATLTGLRNVVGKRVSEVIPGLREANPGLFEIYGRVARTGKPERFEEYVAPLGIWFSVSVYSPEQDHFIAVFDNVTERKAQETELEERVRSRTAALKFANEELEAFAYSVSHDLRAPLRAIEGFSQIVLEEYAGKIDAEADRLLNVIRANTRRMDHLITGLLALSRISRSGMHFSPIDMTVLADSVYHEIVPAEVRQTFAFSVAPLPEACGDLTLLRQVWSNLLSNAVKYTMPKADRRIEIGGYEDNGMHVYYVKDSGVGFNPAYIHKLFGVFQRLHKAEEFEGTGVGLAIVRRIIRRHGGETWAEGIVNHGATIFFSLPGKVSDREQP